MKTLIVRTIFGLLMFGTVMMHAQASRTWISGVGDDANPCSRTEPCKTFAGAISKTEAGGEIDALDPAEYGAVTITKAITIEGGGPAAPVLVSGTNGIVIQASPSDVVILRNLRIKGSVFPISSNLYLSGTDTNLGFPFFPVENASDYDATIIIKTISLDSLKVAISNTQKEWLDAALVNDTNSIKARASTNDEGIFAVASFNSTSAKTNAILLPYKKGRIGENETPLQTISSGATKTIGEEVKSPNAKDDADRWPTANGNGFTSSIQAAALRCFHCGEPGGELCATDIVSGNWYTAPSTGSISMRPITKTLT
jgi:hypothetical protein